MAGMVTDAKGRKITLRDLTVLDQVKMLRAIGPKQAENQPYYGMVESACMASAIDGVPVIMPANESQIDAVIAKLGDEGMAAIMVHRVAAIQATVRAAEQAAERAAEHAEAEPESPLAPSGC